MYVCMYTKRSCGMWIMDNKQKRKEKMKLIIPHLVLLTVESYMGKRVESSERRCRALKVGGD